MGIVPDPRNIFINILTWTLQDRDLPPDSQEGGVKKKHTELLNGIQFGQLLVIPKKKPRPKNPKDRPEQRTNPTRPISFRGSARGVKGVFKGDLVAKGPDGEKGNRQLGRKLLEDQDGRDALLQLNDY